MMKHRNSLYYHGKEEHGVHLSARKTQSPALQTKSLAKDKHISPVHHLSASRDTTSTVATQKVKTTHRQSHIPPPAGKVNRDSTRAITSSVSHQQDRSTTDHRNIATTPSPTRIAGDTDTSILADVLNVIWPIKDVPDPVEDVLSVIQAVKFGDCNIDTVPIYQAPLSDTSRRS
jgi:hypothetical protein